MMTPKRTFVLLWLALTLGGLLIIGLVALERLACEGQPINNNVQPTLAQAIYGERTIGQSFVAPRDGLNRVDVMFQTYGRRNTGPVQLALFEVSQPERPVFSTTFRAESVRDQTWRSFALPPLADSGGRAYRLELQARQATPDNSLTVGGIERNAYLPGTAYLNQTPVPADFSFRTCYRLSPAEKIAVLLGQLSADRPGPWGVAAFYGLLVGLYAGLVALFFRGLLTA